MKIRDGISELIGNTPLMRLNNYIRDNSLEADILAKVEFFNPAGSVKDRVAAHMIETAEKEGRLREGSVIIEPTSGNTGIGLAAVGAAKGYKVILTMPDTMSAERRAILKAYGAEIVLTEGVRGMSGAIEKAEEIAAETDGAVIMGQFTNPSNPESHYLTTGPEIWEDTDGKVDIFVAGAGTGGTVSGTARYLKEKNPDIKVVAFEPSGSPFITEGRAGAHRLEGIGAGFIPDNLELSLIDEVLTVSNEDAFRAGRALARREGLLVGITSGASVHAAAVLARRPENKGKTIVCLLPDTGTRYLSGEMFDD